MAGSHEERALGLEPPPLLPPCPSAAIPLLLGASPMQRIFFALPGVKLVVLWVLS